MPHWKERRAIRMSWVHTVTIGCSFRLLRNRNPALPLGQAAILLSQMIFVSIQGLALSGGPIRHFGSHFCIGHSQIPDSLPSGLLCC